LFRRPLDGQWYRGLVLGPPKAGRVKVFAPDFGFTEQAAVRGLHGVRRPSRAVAAEPFWARPCRLAGGSGLQGGARAALRVTGGQGVLALVELEG
jgi:hypothetical protein